MGINKDLRFIYLVTIASSLILMLGWGVQTCHDSFTYIAAWDNISEGTIDIFRTPIYPLFLGIIKRCVGEKYFCVIVMCVQHLIFLVSVRYFYMITQLIIPIRRITFAISFFYSTLSFLIIWNNYIMTESFAISGMVFLIYLILKMCMCQTSSIRYGIFYVILLFILIFLRPAFVYLFPVLTITWICLFFYKKKRKIAFYGICGVFIVALSLLSYMKAFEHKYEVFASSSVTTLNQLVIARQYGLLEPNSIANPKLKQDVIKSNKKHGERWNDGSYEIWTEAFYLIDTYDLKTLNTAISYSQKNNLHGWLSSCGGRFVRSTYYPIFSAYYLRGLGIVSDISVPPLKILYWFLAIYTFVLFFWIKKTRIYPWISSLLYLLCISNVILSIMCTPDEYPRLITASIPLILIMFGQICAMFKMVALRKYRFL